jgi:hypothetical protein
MSCDMRAVGGPRATRVMPMASGKQQHQPEPELHGGVLAGNGSPVLWGWLIGLVVFAFVAVPISIAVRFATHPATQQLFGGRLEEASSAAYSTFWWIIAIFLFAVPVLIGWGVAKLSGRTLGIIVAILAVFFIAILIFGQLF